MALVFHVLLVQLKLFHFREVRAESGAWFFEQEKRKADRPQLYGSALVRASFRRAKPASQAKDGQCYRKGIYYNGAYTSTAVGGLHSFSVHTVATVLISLLVDIGLRLVLALI